MKLLKKNLITSLWIVLLLGIASCASVQRPDNTKPMYGEVPKSASYQEIDKRFIQEAIRFHGNIENAVDYHLGLAWTLFFKGDLNVAMMRFNQVWLLNPEIPDVYFGFAALSELRRNKTEAERFYKIAFEKDTDNTRAKNCFLHIIGCKEGIGYIDGVFNTINRFIEMFPADSLTNAMFLIKKGYWQVELGKDNLAMESYNKALEFDPNSANAYVNRGYLFQTQKEFSKARADYNKAIEIDSNYIRAFANKGNLELSLSNYEEAKKDFEISVSLDQKSGQLRRHLGMAKQKLNDKEGACEDFKLAKELGDVEASELLKQHCE